MLSCLSHVAAKKSKIIHHLSNCIRHVDTWKSDPVCNGALADAVSCAASAVTS